MEQLARALTQNWNEWVSPSSILKSGVLPWDVGDKGGFAERVVGSTCGRSLELYTTVCSAGRGVMIGSARVVCSNACSPL